MRISPRPARAWASLALLLAGVVTPWHASANPVGIHDPEQIRDSVRSFLAGMITLGEQDEIRVDSLDERLRLAKCSVKTEHYLPNGARLEGRLVVGTRCDGEQRWSIFVPVEILRYAEVAVLNQALARGAALTPEMLQLQRYNLNELQSGYFLSMDKVVGQTLKHPLTAGTVLTPGNLQPAIKVKRGEIVNILASKGPIFVKMQGKALANGAEGEKIRVLNHVSKRIVEGTVTYEGNVEVGL